ncbi:disulfide bond formation protein B [Candidatus Woesearchaeota archaeon]|nr:disulfide bond formation protein B [Candidatus Woesearchaeota archaeon]MCF7901286.1 disulfide bond formation protein B [Candidatus Woesearchaeota archaeon]MCF8013773.1 disulfide bond formation protein B [Candidatus Woesearchaeota archaeon]
MIIDTANFILSTLTLIGCVFVVIYLVYLLSTKIFKIQGVLDSFFSKHGLLFTFIISLLATLGSLFYSKIAGYNPCELCWYQRILMYPIVLLSGIALLKKDYSVKKYIIPMSVIGGLFALYHYYIQTMSVITSCTADAASCISKYTFHYGYITIPMMALTAFVMIIIFVNYTKKK